MVANHLGLMQVLNHSRPSVAPTSEAKPCMAERVRDVVIAPTTPSSSYHTVIAVGTPLLHSYQMKERARRYRQW